ncbi:MAG: hypothetical protein U0625_07385 [Phycisphaerales bacterium]
MPRMIEILSEQEGESGWTFQVQQILADGSLQSTRLTMSWQEYDLYCPDGAVPPEGVARAVAEVAAEMWPRGLPPRLDASTLRRHSPGADARVAERVDLRAM